MRGEIGLVWDSYPGRPTDRSVDRFTYIPTHSTHIQRTQCRARRRRSPTRPWPPSRLTTGGVDTTRTRRRRRMASFCFCPPCPQPPVAPDAAPGCSCLLLAAAYVRCDAAIMQASVACFCQRQVGLLDRCDVDGRADGPCVQWGVQRGCETGRVGWMKVGLFGNGRSGQSSQQGSARGFQERRRMSERRRRAGACVLSNGSSYRSKSRSKASTKDCCCHCCLPLIDRLYLPPRTDRLSIPTPPAIPAGRQGDSSGAERRLSSSAIEIGAAAAATSEC